MTMQRWDPFGEMLSLRSAMDRLMEDAYVRPGRQGAAVSAGQFPLDVIEEGDQLIVKASLPGVKPADVNVSVQGNVVSISGETRADTERKGTVHYQEHRYGKMSRTVSLPTRVNAEKASASFEHGVLTLTLPKDEGAKARQIPIQAQSSSPAIETTSATQPSIAANGGNAAQAKDSSPGNAKAPAGAKS